MKTKSWQRKRRQYWQDWYKMRKGCEFCGYNKHPRALCFDHINPETKNILTKNGNVDRMRSGGMWQLTNPNVPLRVMIDEWRKCRILCSNCHMEHSYVNGKGPSGKRDKSIVERATLKSFFI